MVRRRVAWLTALAIGAVVACGSRSGGGTGDADGGGGGDATADAGLPACGASPHSDGFCTAWAHSCVACGLLLSSCEREHFDELCMADEQLRSIVYVAGVTGCDRAQPSLSNGWLCGAGSNIGGPPVCMLDVLNGGRTGWVTVVAKGYCAACPFSESYGADCIEKLGAALATYGWSDVVWSSVSTRCLPSADAGPACEVDFFSCAEKVFADAHAAGPCGTQRSLYF